LVLTLGERVLALPENQGDEESNLSVKDRARESSFVNWAANYLTPRNIGRYLGHTVMEVAIEIFWARQRQVRDLTAMISDQFVQQGSTVIDVGASWGLFSYHLARRVGEEGRVYSYEPHPANAVVLEKLARARPYVHFRPAAVSVAAGRAELLVPKHRSRLVTAQSSLAHGFDGMEVQRIKVQTVALDDEIAPEHWVDFVKIDVEGNEMSVLRGGVSMFRRCLPTILIEIEQRHLAVPIEEIFHQFEELGYYVFYIDESVLRPISGFDVKRDQLSKLPKDQFTPFSAPRDYVCDFCAVRTPALLQGLPVVS
jgi:FkbM family methyltransferase